MVGGGLSWGGDLELWWWWEVKCARQGLPARCFGIAGLLHFTSTSTSCALYKDIYSVLVCAGFRMDHGHMDHGGMDMGHGPMCNMNVRHSQSLAIQ